MDKKIAKITEFHKVYTITFTDGSTVRFYESNIMCY